MNLLTWNCNRAFRRKKDLALQLDPDILVIQECEDPNRIKADWDDFSDWVWVGDNKHKGLCIFTRNSFHLKKYDLNKCNTRYILPVMISGPVNLNLIGVWAMNDVTDPKRRYIGQVYTALQHCQNILGKKCLVAGDFNWNAIFDSSTKYPLYGNFEDTITLLQKKDMYSIYHTINNCTFGNEPDPTFYMHKKQDRPYHVDYIFASKDISNSTFCTGRFDNWHTFSDHMPMLATFNLCD